MPAKNVRMNIADRSFSVQAGKIIPHERWGWEQRKEINVFGVSRPLRREALGQVRLEIQALLDEFDLPIQATVGSAGPSLNALVRLLRQCSHGRSLDVPTFVDRLNDARRSRKIFESALVILVGDKDYEPFGEPPDKAPGFYGESHADGVCLLRAFHAEAVRHEGAHMLGLEQHCRRPDCVMNWSCPTVHFCDSCRLDLRRIWQSARKAKRPGRIHG